MHCSSPRLYLMLSLALLLAGCTAESRKQRALDRASGYYRAGDLEKARLEYQSVLQKFPDDPVANERLALIWHDRGAFVKALLFLNKSKELSPGNLQLRLKRARILQHFGATVIVRAEARDLLTRMPSLGEALLLQVELVRDAEDFRAAEQAVRGFPDKLSAPYHLATANLQRLRGERDQAVVSARRALSSEPHAAMARLLLAGLYSELGRGAEALAELKSAVQVAPLRSLERVRAAALLARTGGAEEATAALEEVTKKAADYLPAWRGLAELATLRGRHEEAIKLLQGVLKQDALNYEARLQLAAISMLTGATPRAIEEMLQLGRDFPGFGLEKYQLALAFLRENKIAQAIEALRETVSRFPDNFEAMLLLGELQLRNGTPEPALATFQTLLSRRPDLLQAYPLFLESARSTGRLAEMARQMDEGAKKNPGNRFQWYLLGQARLLLQQPSEARQSFERCMEVAPDFLQPALELVMLDLRESKVGEARARAEELAAKFPTVSATHYVLAQACAAERRWTEATAAARRAFEREPAAAKMRNMLAQLLPQIADEPAASGLLDELRTRHPQDEQLAILAGGFYARLRRPDQQREVYEGFLAQVPKGTLVLNNLANLCLDSLNQPERALELARRAHELDPKSPVIKDTLAWVLYRTGRMDEALPLAEQAAREGPKVAESRYHLGVMLRRLGRNEAALAEFREAVASPQNFNGKDDARRQLAELEKAVGGGGKPE